MKRPRSYTCMGRFTNLYEDAEEDDDDDDSMAFVPQNLLGVQPPI